MEEILSEIKSLGEKTYIYLFEDGTITQSKESPTKEDFQSINEGVLNVLVTSNTVCILASDGKKCEIKDVNEEEDDWTHEGGE